MKILALDSSGLVASVAILEDDIIVGEYTTNYKKTHSQTLLPMLQAVTEMVDADLSEMDAIAVAAGPGSFTGLRIGSATAKGLGLALSKPIVAVPTVDGLAYNLYGSASLICPLLDARRGQVYSGIYEFVKDTNNVEHSYRMNILVPQCASDMEKMVAKLNELGRDVVFLGDGVPVFKSLIIETMKVPFSFAPGGQNRQKASSIAMLGMEYFKQGKIQTAAEHQPEYLRLSQAERERLEKEG